MSQPVVGPHFIGGRHSHLGNVLNFAAGGLKRVRCPYTGDLMKHVMTNNILATQKQNDQVNRAGKKSGSPSKPGRRVRRSKAKPQGLDWTEARANPVYAQFLLARSGVLCVRGCPDHFEAENVACAITQSAFALQPQGRIETEVKAVPSKSSRSGAESWRPIPPHTDGNSLRRKVRYVGLYCEFPGIGTPTPTKVASMWGLLDQLTREEIKFCLTKKFIFTHTHDVYGTAKIESPILTFEDGVPILRYSENLFLRGESNPEVAETSYSFERIDKTLLAICKKVAAYCVSSKNQIAVMLERGDLLLVNNLEHFHWRDTPAQEGRHLTRFWLH